MGIEVNLDLMFVKRKMKLIELSQRVGISGTNRSLLKAGALQPSFLRWAVGLDIRSKIFLLYALLRFRRLLNQRYEFHAVDRLIIAVYVAAVSLGVVSYLMRIFPESKIPTLVTGSMLMLTCGILGII